LAEESQPEKPDWNQAQSWGLFLVQLQRGSKRVLFLPEPDSLATNKNRSKALQPFLKQIQTFFRRTATTFHQRFGNIPICKSLHAWGGHSPNGLACLKYFLCYERTNSLMRAKRRPVLHSHRGMHLWRVLGSKSSS